MKIIKKIINNPGIILLYLMDKNFFGFYQIKITLN